MKRGKMRMTGAGLALAVLMTTSGCVNVTAPDKPIEIVLTINIRQEIVYRLDRDAKELIESNTEIF
jgi:YnbE-like lipoprotein